jgi:hypothetical protein
MSHINCLTSLIILSAFLLIFFVGLVKMISHLSEMSVHVSPYMLTMPQIRASGVDEGHANATAAYESIPAELGESG